MENGSESTETSKTTKEDGDADIGEEQTMSSNSESDDFEKQTTEASLSDRSSSSHDSTTEDGSKTDLRGGSEGGGGTGSCRSCSTPLRLRRLPASFWQEPNVPKDRGRKRPVPCKACHGALRSSCHPPPSNHLFYPTKDHRMMQFGSYGDGDFLGGRFRDPGASPSLPGLTAASQSGGGTFYPATDLFCLDPPPTPSSPTGSTLGAPGFLPLPSSIRLGPVGAPTELPVAAGAGTPCSSFFATAALYGHVMRRSLHSSGSSYRHGNGGYGDVMAATSSGSLDDLWRLFPCRPLPEVFGSKRFHPYL